MPIYHVFVVNRAGSLIYDWDTAPRAPDLEKTLSFPVDFRLEAIDQRPTVVFGERDGVRVGHVVLAVNGRPVQAGRVTFEGSENDVDVLTVTIYNSLVHRILLFPYFFLSLMFN
jgi:hypothetical protein